MLHSFKIHDDEESFPTIYTFVIDLYKVIVKNNFLFFNSNNKSLEIKDFRSIILFCSNIDRKIFDLIIKKDYKVKNLHFYRDHCGSLYFQINKLNYQI